MLLAQPQATQAPGPITIPDVLDDRGYRFVATCSRPAETPAVPAPDWTLVLSIVSNTTTPPINVLHRKPLLTNAQILVLGDLYPNLAAFNVRLAEIYTAHAALLPDNV